MTQLHLPQGHPAPRSDPAASCGRRRGLSGLPALNRPAPRPGTLEWHADQRPDEVAIVTPAGGLPRAEWERRANALAERLVRDDAVWPGALLSGAGTIDEDWLTLSWAAAKLGAGLVGLPPAPAAGLADVLPVSPGAPEPDVVPRRLSGHHAPPDAISFSRRGRAVRRSFPAERLLAIAPTLADLIDRLRAAPGTTLALSGPVSDPLLSFLAGVVLVGGGRVACADTPAGALALAAEHGAELVALAPAALRDLDALTADEREQLDLTNVEAVITGGGPLDDDAVRLLDDLVGLETLLDVYLTADTGIAAVRGGDEREHTLLDGVEARTGPGGGLELRSPLAATPGWTRTGDTARLTTDGRLSV